jgi:hypothetical protein
MPDKETTHDYNMCIQALFSYLLIPIAVGGGDLARRHRNEPW